MIFLGVYILLFIYSFTCAPDVFFRLFEFRDTPEYAFAYFVGCVILAVTLMGAVLRVWFLLRASET